jgi:hypothetical protein
VPGQSFGGSQDPVRSGILKGEYPALWFGPPPARELSQVVGSRAGARVERFAIGPPGASIQLGSIIHGFA